MILNNNPRNNCHPRLRLAAFHKQALSSRPSGCVLTQPEAEGPAFGFRFEHYNCPDRATRYVYLPHRMPNFQQRRRSLWICFFVLLAILALTAAFTSATTLARMSFDALAQQSSAVARLRCLGSEYRWDRGELWTDTRFQLVEASKGSLPAVLTVRTIGGISGSLHSHVDGVPIFRAGEEVYLFLWERAGEPYRVFGWAQGTFRILRNEQSGTETVTQDSAAAPLFDPRTRAFRHGGIRNLPLPIFQLKLRRALERQN
jgi:hypothetical protein